MGMAHVVKANMREDRVSPHHLFPNLIVEIVDVVEGCVSSISIVTTQIAWSIQVEDAPGLLRSPASILEFRRDRTRSMAQQNGEKLL
tara:strand:- start:886 stop:1146 length:261 start_codon:yes stop_codon:yes gene_type:complete